MSKELYNAPWTNPPCPIPGGADATTAGECRGGYDLTDMPRETPNMSELGGAIVLTAVKDGPAPWSQVAVEPGVASPAVPAASIQKIGS
jgi:hypothetical protein